MPRDVKTNLANSDIHDALLQTFEKWMKFSMGVGKLGGRMLRHPSGRMAAALKAESDQEGNVIAIYVDHEELGAEEHDLLTTGHKKFSLKDRMLQPGKPGVKRSKAGFLYKYVTIADNPISAKQSYKSAVHIKNLFTGQETDHGGVFGINKNLAKMWASNYKKAHKNSDKIVTMTNKPGSKKWIIPAMPAFNINRLLREITPNKIKDRIII